MLNWLYWNIVHKEEENSNAILFYHAGSLTKLVQHLLNLLYMTKKSVLIKILSGGGQRFICYIIQLKIRVLVQYY